MTLEKEDRSHLCVTQKTSKKEKRKEIARSNGVSFIDTLAMKYSCRNRGYQISMPIDTHRSILFGIAMYRLTKSVTRLRNDREAGVFCARLGIGEWLSRRHCFSLFRENRRWQFGKHSKPAGIHGWISKLRRRQEYRSWGGFLRETVSCISYRLEFRKSMSGYSYMIYCTCMCNSAFNVSCCVWHWNRSDNSV